MRITPEESGGRKVSYGAPVSSSCTFLIRNDLTETNRDARPVPPEGYSTSQDGGTCGRNANKADCGEAILADPLAHTASSAHAGWPPLLLERLQRSLHLFAFGNPSATEWPVGKLYFISSLELR